MLTLLLATNGGLSPRVRGNPTDDAVGQTALRSIPACAGEPLQCKEESMNDKVYPRVCGGTRRRR